MRHLPAAAALCRDLHAARRMRIKLCGFELALGMYGHIRNVYAAPGPRRVRNIDDRHDMRGDPWRSWRLHRWNRDQQELPAVDVLTAIPTAIPK
jgi:hypothetical protein